MGNFNHYYFGVKTHEGKKITCVVHASTEAEARVMLDADFAKQGGYATAVLLKTAELV